MKWSTQKVIIFQTGIIKECMEYKKEVVIEVPKREEKIVQPIKETLPSRNAVKSEQPKKVEVKSSGTKLSYWQNVLDKIKQSGKVMIYTNLIGTVATQINDMTVGIEFPRKNYRIC